MDSDQQFPTLDQVTQATHEQLARWHRFLPSAVIHPYNQQVQARIAERLSDLGGMTPELSKKIGWSAS